MAELALYRKYRSRRFSEVVGQKHIISTLVSALTNERTSHAYLFTGPRGVGKTSVARLLALGLNCTGEVEASEKPCGKCVFCTRPLEGNLDIYEIDAASNRRIDEIRELRDKISLAPSLGRFKVYIIDEVHMLTTEAFNALLKTLEEPPAHAIFILATTEAHKLPETIVSRTQRFNFKPISMSDLESHLRMIAEAEQIKIEPEAVTILAAASQGGFRDAISLLDQVASSGSQLNAPAVRQILGWSDHETIDEISISLAEHNPSEALAALDRALAQGAQINQIIAQLAERFRGIMLLQARGQESAVPLARQLSLAQTVKIIEHLLAASKSGWPQLALESTLVRLAARREELRQSEQAPLSQPKELPKTTSSSQTSSTSLSTELWPKVLLLIKGQNNSLYALLRSCEVGIIASEVTVTCRFKFHRDRLQEPKNREVIEAALKKVYQVDLRVVCQLDPATAPAAKSEQPEVELITSALEIFGGEVVDG